MSPDPGYQPDVQGLADDLQRRHGPQALNVAVDHAKQHMHAAAWKHCTMWLQVVNRLTPSPAAPSSALS